MQRNNKYRGQAVDTKEWVYGNLIGKDWITGDVVDWDTDYICLEKWQRVKEDTVGQYTGLKDKNGKEIYEGDIVEIGDCKAVIKWDKKSASFYAFDENHDVRTTHIAYANLTKVIGNVYNNPELLQEV